MDPVYIHCDCRTPYHVLQLIPSWDDPYAPDMFASMFMDSRGSFWQKVKMCFNFLFRKGEISFDEVLISREKALQIADLMLEYVGKCDEWDAVKEELPGGCGNDDGCCGGCKDGGGCCKEGK